MTLIIDTAKLLRPTLGEQIEIESVFEDEACMATVDPNQLATAILNLALNARDAMPNGGKLILETGMAFLDESYAGMHGDVRPGRYALIAVSDTGTGIPAAILDKVFNPFFTSKGPGKGTGLGLSMVYGFVKQSAGHIKIYSEEGHGTTIKMYLPPGTGALSAAEDAVAAAVEGGHETILVVEDDKLVRDYVLTQLHSLGYVTLDAANAAEALAIVEAGKDFDLLFTDVIMPGTMNGRQLANELQKTQTRAQGAVHLGLHRKCDHPSRPARFRRPAARQAVSQVGSGGDDPQGAGRLGRFGDRDRSTVTRRGHRSAGRSSAARCGHHNSNEIGRIPGAELLHDVGAMILDGARADSEMAPGFLVGRARGELLQHLAFAPRQRFPSRKMQRRGFRRGVLCLPACICADRFIEPGHDFAAAERLFDEVQRAILDRADRHGDVALAGDHEDRRRIVLAVKLLQDIEAGFAGNMHIEQDAGRSPGARDRQQRRAVRKADHLIAARRQHHRQGVANGGIVVDDEDLAVGRQDSQPWASSSTVQRNTYSRNDTKRRTDSSHPYLYGTRT